MAEHIQCERNAISPLGEVGRAEWPCYPVLPLLVALALRKRKRFQATLTRDLLADVVQAEPIAISAVRAHNAKTKFQNAVFGELIQRQGRQVILGAFGN